MNEHMLSHLHNVVEDSLVLSWNAVRRFSQNVFDQIEKGKLSWDDSSAIQTLRNRSAVIGDPKGRGSAVTHTTNAKQPSDGKDVACQEFNSQRGCPFPRDHSDNFRKYLHACAYCLAVTKRMFGGHNATNCERLNGERKPGGRSGQATNPTPTPFSQSMATKNGRAPQLQQ